MATVFIHPDRKPPRFRPLKALQHFKKLLANKEDTEQVFHIIQALAGKTYQQNLRGFAASKTGAARIAERTYLPPMLDDHDALRQLPVGSVGRVYVDFMEREGLTAQGLVDEYGGFEEKVTTYDDDLDWYGNRLRDTHDLLHVLTGYGRDALGEATLLAFSHGQHKSPGAIFIAYLATREMQKAVPKGLSLKKVYKEGKRNGKTSVSIAEEDISALLAENLEEARKRLNIKPPTAYRNALNIFDTQGLDPYQVLQPA